MSLVLRNRRQFIRQLSIAAGGIALFPVAGLAQDIDEDRILSKNIASAGDKGPQINRATAQEFVRISHSDGEGVRQMVAEEPQLVVASWDWGGGDYESGLGAASHVGNRGNAEFLLEKGARPNLFTATMLGWEDVVRGILTRNPELIGCNGPHGLSLIHHAQKGGEPADGVLTSLEDMARSEIG